MADLYHLLDELQEREEEANNVRQDEDDDDEGQILLAEEDDDNSERGRARASVRGKSKTTNDNRRETFETAATADMSYGNEDDDEGYGFDNMDGAHPVIPESLRQRNRADEGQQYDDEDVGGGINDLLEEEFDDLKATNKAGTRSLLQDEEEEMGQSKGIYAKLHQQWLQERHCPELLPYDEHLVEDLKLELEQKQEDLDDQMESIRGSAEEKAVQLLMADLQQQDLDRAKFVLADWLNQRLHKMEAHALHILRTRADRLSDIERDYLTKYQALVEKHLQKTVTTHLLEAWKELDSPEMIDTPDYSGYHFWLVKGEPLVEMDVDQVHDVGSCLIAKYTKMREHLESGKVELLI